MITVMTATYNRAYTLTRLYESLECQSDKRFKWVVVDDGSSDDTMNLLRSFQAVASFPIVVINQLNSGKHIAINSGVLASTDEWFFLVDSDDVLTPNAIEVFFKNIVDSQCENLVGYCYRRADLSGRLIGASVSTVSGSSVFMTPTQAGNFYKGDLAYIFRREILLKYPFPKFKGENFVPELLVWNQVSDEGEILFFHDQAIYLCEYLEDGYTANFNQNLRRNPCGFGIYYKNQIRREVSIARKVKCAVRYLQCLFFALVKK